MAPRSGFGAAPAIKQLIVDYSPLIYLLLMIDGRCFQQADIPRLPISQLSGSTNCKKY